MKFSIHKKFKLNGYSFNSNDELIDFSDSVSNELSDFLKRFLNTSNCIQLQTSGSTGTPKLIEVKKEFMLNSAKATGAFFNLGEGTKALLCMNPNYVGGKMMLVRALVLGWSLDVVPPSLNPLKELKKEYDFCAMVPLQVSNSLIDFYKIKKLIIGGGVVSKDLENQLQVLSTECFSTYGMTETVSHIAVKKLNNFDTKKSSSDKKSYYKILKNISISKDDRNCLVIDASKISDEVVITNDVVEFISDKEFKWLGRFDNIINSGGVKLNPELVEEKLSSIIKERFFVAGVSDGELGEKLVLIIEGDHKKNIILNKVKELQTLSKYEIPKEVYFVPEFIKTETKKIQRKKTLDLIKL